jgi:hypothetical protein
MTIRGQAASAIRAVFGVRRQPQPQKIEVHRDRAAREFLAHCRAEAARLKESVLPPLRAYCDGRHGRPSFDAVASLPLLRHGGGGFDQVSGTLLDAHCHAIAAAAGLDAIAGNIDPPHQSEVMEWEAYRLIAEADVGEANVGHCPSPRPKPGLYVSWAPGSFVGGIASSQLKLTKRYRILRTPAERLTLFLLSLRVHVPRNGVGRTVYEKVDLGDGIETKYGVVAMNSVAVARLEPEAMDEWEENLEIFDTDAALSESPVEIVRVLLAAIGRVDPFWPEYCCQHRLTWLP